MPERETKANRPGATSGLLSRIRATTSTPTPATSSPAPAPATPTPQSITSQTQQDSAEIIARMMIDDNIIDGWNEDTRSFSSSAQPKLDLARLLAEARILNEVGLFWRFRVGIGV
jgi:hypothetical protein